MREMTVWALVLFTFTGFSQNIEIPDPRFKDYLLNGAWELELADGYLFYSNFDTNDDGEISIAEAEMVTGNMYCFGREIQDLTGIEYFVNLKGLHCYSNLLTELPDLSALTNLRILRVADNQLQALPPLTPSLTYLDFSLNQIAGERSFLHFEDLLVLFCSDNQITHLDLPSRLEFLNFNNNLIETIDPPTTLKSLNCSGNLLKHLPDMPNLTTLVFANNQVTKIPLVSKRLRTLSCGGNQIAYLPDLSQYPDLFMLKCENNKLTYLPDLSELDLNSLDCSNNLLRALPALPRGLKQLYCGSNRLARVPDPKDLPLLQALVLEDNLLDLDDCAAINGFAQRGPYRFRVNPQADGVVLDCENQSPALKAIVPWMARSDEWQSRISVFNKGSREAPVHLRAISRDGIQVEAEVTVPGHSVSAFESHELFGDLSGFSVMVHSHSPDIYASYLIFNRRTDSAASPSLSQAPRVDAFSDALLFSYLSGEMISAMVVIAPYEEDTLYLSFELHDEKGRLSFARDIPVQGGRPTAFLAEDLFEVVPKNASVTVRAHNGAMLTGAGFTFNTHRGTRPDPSGSNRTALISWDRPG